MIDLIDAIKPVTEKVVVQKPATGVQGHQGARPQAASRRRLSHQLTIRIWVTASPLRPSQT